MSSSSEITECRRLRELGQYVEAVARLEVVLNDRQDNLPVRGELAETLAAQGYMRKAYQLLDEVLGAGNLPDHQSNGDASALSYLQMQWCLYTIYTTCSFNKAISYASKVYQEVLASIEVNTMDRYSGYAISYYCRILCIGALLKKPIPLSLDALAEEKIRPIFQGFLQRSLFREALRSAMDYKRCISDQNSCNLLRQLIQHSGGTSLVKADALMDSLDLLKTSSISSGYQNALNEARTHYKSANHAHGELDINFREACDRLMNASPENRGKFSFDEYLSQYSTMNYLTGEEISLNLLLHAVENFPKLDIKLAILQKGREVTLRGGSILTGSLRDIQILTRWLSRAGHSAKIIENANSLWNQVNQSDCYFLQGQVAQILSHAFIWVGDQNEAIKWGEACEGAWNKCSAFDRSQGRTVALRAMFLKRGVYTGMEKDKIVSRSRIQARDDIENGFIAPAIEKLEVLLIELVATPFRTPEQELAVKEMMAQIEELVEKLPKSEYIEKLVNLYQSRVSVLLREAGTRGDIIKEEEGLELTTKAVAISLKEKKVFEAANTLQIAALLVYSIFQKQREASILQNCYDRFVAARDAFKGIGTIHHEFVASYWVSQVLYDGWCRGWVLTDFVLKTFVETEKLFDQQRSEISILEGLDAITTKQRLTLDEYIRALYRYAIRICFMENRTEDVWEWVQKTKARSLSDLLGLDVSIPESLKSIITSEPARKDLFDKETLLLENIRKAGIADRLALRGVLDTLQDEMRKDAAFEELFAIREGRPILLRELSQGLLEVCITHPGLNIIFIDWFTFEEEICLSVFNGKGSSGGIQIIRTAHYMWEIHRWKEEYLDSPFGREDTFETDNSEDNPLRRLDFLVTPLANIAEEGDMFIFSVSGPLHRIPMHALWLSYDTPVIDLHPVAYCANLTSFVQCWRRANNRNTSVTQKAMIGVYEPTQGLPFQPKEQEEVYASITKLAKTNKSNCLLGRSVDDVSFKTAFESSSILHFHGHCIFDSKSIISQSLVLSNSTFSVPDFFELNLQSPHITLIACDSASQSINAGDEPLGVVTALLCAGAASVIGTLWPIPSGVGRMFSEEFYREVGRLEEEGEENGNGWINLVGAMREAILEIKGDWRTRQVYFWGSFVLHGAWFFKT